MEYSAVIYHPMLTAEQEDYIERQQVRALKNIYGNELSHNKLLELSGLPRLSDRRLEACQKFAKKMSNNPRFQHLFKQKQARSRASVGTHYIEQGARTNRRFNSVS